MWTGTKRGELGPTCDPYRKESTMEEAPNSQVDKMTSASGVKSHVAGLEWTQLDGCPPTKADLVSLTAECSSYQ